MAVNFSDVAGYTHRWSMAYKNLIIESFFFYYEFLLLFTYIRIGELLEALDVVEHKKSAKTKLDSPGVSSSSRYVTV